MSYLSSSKVQLTIRVLTLRILLHKNCNQYSHIKVSKYIKNLLQNDSLALRRLRLSLKHIFTE